MTGQTDARLLSAAETLAAAELYTPAVLVVERLSRESLTPPERDRLLELSKSMVETIRARKRAGMGDGLPDLEGLAGLPVM